MLFVAQVLSQHATDTVGSGLAVLANALHVNPTTNRPLNREPLPLGPS